MKDEANMPAADAGQLDPGVGRLVEKRKDMSMTPKRLLAALAPEEPLNNDEMGGCMHCGGEPPGHRYGWAGRFLEDHRPGCAWVKARRLLGDKLPATRKTPNALAQRRPAE
jgi:hypothetical protein